MPSKQGDFMILADKDGLHVWQELQNLKWYCHIVRDDEIVIADLGPFDSKVQALHRAIHEYLRTDQRPNDANLTPAWTVAGVMIYRPQSDTDCQIRDAVFQR